jgi:copper(I)-binding protein
MTAPCFHVALAAILVLGACRESGLPAAAATAGDLRIDRGFAYEPITAASGAAYFRIRNGGGVADTLLEATSPATQGASLHGSGMAHLEVLPVPAGGEVELKPGATHLMLTGFRVVPKAGESLAVTLRFAHTGNVTLQLPVRRYGQ